jgi:type I protein arginine methyltransferase
VQAGARKVYAVEASQMARKMRKIVDAANLPPDHKMAKNGFLKDKIEIIQGRAKHTAAPQCQQTMTCCLSRVIFACLQPK